VIAHTMHNTLLVLAGREDGLRPWLERWQFVSAGGEEVFPPPLWLAGAAALLVGGLVLAALAPGARTSPLVRPAIGKAAGP
jgi:hypothetical protein